MKKHTVTETFFVFDYSSADTIIKNMDLTVDPCVDFYQYACGGFDKRVGNLSRVHNIWLKSV